MLYTVSMTGKSLALLVVLALAAAPAACSQGARAPVRPEFENITLSAPPPSPWPRVERFEASATNIMPGENVTLRWSVQDAGSVSIEPGVGTVAASGSAAVSPRKTARYTLTATGEKGSSTAWVQVQVAAAQTYMPDLVITGITHISGLLYYKIKNVGAVDAGQSETFIYDLSNMLRDRSWVEGLKTGEEKTLPFTNYDWKEGKITICADGKNEVAEASEDNNCHVPTFGFKYNYDFGQMLSRASWTGSAGRIRFGENDSARGYAVKANEAAAEDGNVYRNVVETVPPAAAYGWIEGRFGEWQEQFQSGGYMAPMEMPYNARFTASVGLAGEARDSGSASFLFGLQAENGDTEWWPAVKAAYDGKLGSMDIDLSDYGGKKAMALLRVECGPVPCRALPIWISPRISQ
jgi:hypothetical protein